MRIIISGGSGLIGRELIPALSRDGHEVWVLSRSPQSIRLPEMARVSPWDGRTSDGWANLLDGAGAVFNLAGDSLGSGIWTAEKKQRMRDSRLWAGNAITQALQRVQHRPPVLFQASAIGGYGTSETKTFDESQPLGGDFLAGLVADWEGSTAEVEKLGMRRVILRSGLYITPEGGVLPRLMLPFRLFAGGPLGSGQQWYSWIHPQDWIEAVRFLLKHEELSGPFNLTAPEPVRNAEFGRTVAYITKRPYLFPAPAFAMKLALGEMSTLVLDGQRVLPRRLREAGFKFKFEHLHEALTDLLRKR
jgi:uncharacterized protein